MGTDGVFFSMVLECGVVPSNTYDPSVSELLLVIVFQLGVCILFLAEVAAAARGFETLLSMVGQLIGSITAIGALVYLYVRRRSRPERD